MAGSAGGGEVSYQELVQQVVKLGDELQQMRLDNATLTAKVQILSEMGASGGKGSGGGRPNVKSALRDFKNLYPETFNPKKDVFETWANDFLRWIRAESEVLASALERSSAQTAEIPMPEDEHTSDVRFAWLHLKKLMGDQEAKDIVRTVPKDNALEAWRLLARRYSPKTAATKSRKLRQITNFAEKHENTPATKVLSTIAHFEELNRKYHEEYKAHPLTAELTVDAIKCIIPAEIERSINLNLIGRPEPSYEELKKLVVEYIVQNTPVPMDVGEVGEDQLNDPEDVNSLGKAGVGVGKGKGKGTGSPTYSSSSAAGAGKGKQPEGSCNVCWQMGHYGRDCPNRTPAQIKAAEERRKAAKAKGKGKGKKGKGKGKKGVNGIDDEEWNDDEWKEYESHEEVEESGAIDIVDNFGVYAIDDINDSCTCTSCSTPSSTNMFSSSQAYTSQECFSISSLPTSLSSQECFSISPLSTSPCWRGIRSPMFASSCNLIALKLPSNL